MCIWCTDNISSQLTCVSIPCTQLNTTSLGLRLLSLDDSGADHVVVIGPDAGGVLEGYESMAMNFLESMLVNDEERENLQKQPSS